MFIVVAGLSDIGRNLAELLVKEGNQVTVVDRDPGRCAAIAEGSDIMVITGDAGQKSTLEEARVRNAQAFVAAAGDDSENLMLCMMAKEMGVKTVISIVDEAGHAETFRQAGINLQVNPAIVAAKHIYRLISQPYVKGFLSFEGAEIFEIEIEEDMSCVGKGVAALGIPNGVKVLAVRRGGKYLDEGKEIQPGDWLILIATRESLKKGTDFMNRWFVKG
jgi:trk system potassium uptake protein TrkA